jgi:hypothetical protein
MNDSKQIVNLILKAVALAMAVALVALQSEEDQAEDSA